ncbi:hypothetical protein NKR23_g7435 [Pleurostoma richardsiae]|uniref:Uncharacterized protein n=1 Tax=Pleurostoma richardsiae TaxID=41990 RepID=A0AA38RLL6_9PEZI|nr:hypothetical protein NKR23_g7435 [Pleurostoma richardsiae]
MDPRDTGNPASPPAGSGQSHSRSQSISYSAPLAGTDDMRRKGSVDSTKSSGKDSKGRWFTQLKDWVSTSEPSAQALRKHKKETFKKAGVDLDDPHAHSKLNAPIGEIPDHAIKPAGRGPEPEDVIKDKVEKKRKARQSYSGQSSDSVRTQSFSTGSAPSFESR